MTFLEAMWLIAFSLVAHLFVRALVMFAAQADLPRPPARLTLAWVHHGLVEPEPWDASRWRGLNEIWAGEQTGIWPMVLELKDEPYEPDVPEPVAEAEPEERPEPIETAVADNTTTTPSARDRFATQQPKRKGGRRKVTVDVGGEVRAGVMAG